MNETFFSIIIPVYKVEKYLNQCVDSVLSQTFNDYEIILVDDGSPDNSPLICDEYSASNSRVKVIHKPNGGLSSARNAGLDIAKGKYIIFLDSDDYWCDCYCLEKLNSELKNGEIDIIIFGMKKYYQIDDKFGGERIPEMSGRDVFDNEKITYILMQNNEYVACAWDKVIKRSLIEKSGLRFVEGQLSEDIEWCAKLLLLNPVIRTVPECFYVYRQQNSNSITNNIERRNLENICDIVTRYADIGKEKNNVALLNYTANQYLLWMTVSNLVPKNEIKDLLSIMKSKWFLINYHLYPYVDKAYKFKFLGFGIVRKLLGMYKKIFK